MDRHALEAKVEMYELIAEELENAGKVTKNKAFAAFLKQLYYVDSDELVREIASVHHAEFGPSKISTDTWTGRLAIRLSHAMAEIYCDYLLALGYK